MSRRKRGLLSDRDADAIFNRTRGVRPDFKGHYMFNFRVETPIGPAILREPQPGFSGFDARMIPEAMSLTLAAETGARVPHLFYSGDNFLIEELIDGEMPSVNNWKAWLGGLLRQVELFRHAHVPASSPVRDIYDWQCWMRDFLVDLHAGILDSHGRRLAVLGVPPLSRFWQPDINVGGHLALVHADLHSENLILNSQGTWIIDWELALIADPVWDAAISLHRTRWPDVESEQSAARMWIDSLATEPDLDYLESRLSAYRAIEVWKSLVVDSVKYPRWMRSNPEAANRYIDSFHGKLTRGHSLFGCRMFDRTEVESLLSEWAENSE